MAARRVSVAAIGCGLALLLTACQSHRAISPSPPVGVQPVLHPNWQLEPGDSHFELRVYREGPLSALGHNHVIDFPGVSGVLEWVGGAAPARCAFSVPVAGAVIDDPLRRAQLGADFAEPVSDAARAGTRHNMLGESVLDAAGFPRVALHCLDSRQQPDGKVLVTVVVEVRGIESRHVLPVELRHEAGALLASGSLVLRQSDLGLTPFSVALGALRVADAMQVRIALRAVPVATQSSP